MQSSYLQKLSNEDRQELVSKLNQSQNEKCFICELPIDLKLQDHDIDHIVALNNKGKDGEGNLALTHSACNRSKQASDLEVARALARFDRISPTGEEGQEAINLGDVLGAILGNTAKYKIALREENSILHFSLSHSSTQNVFTVPIYDDILSNFRTAFVFVPIKYISHDDIINPRPIVGKNMRKLIEEFHKGFPQLHVALGWVDLEQSSTVKIFDGQHKVAAQVLLNVQEIPIRIFINPDKESLLTANTNAGTTLRQVAFDKSIQRKIGHEQLKNRIHRFNKDKGRLEHDGEFSEQDLVNHFVGERKEIEGYVIDRLRDRITNDPDNKLKGFIEYGGRATGKPFSYSTVDKTFYALFISKKLLTKSFDFRMDENLNPRENEIGQIVRLMNIIADKIYVNKFDAKLGTFQIEHRLRKGEFIPNDHLRAFRMAREEILSGWLHCIKEVINQYYAYVRVLRFDSNVVFQDPLPAAAWQNVSNFIDSLAGLPIWVDRQLSSTVFGTKQNREFWEQVFKEGTVGDQVVLTSGLDLVEMIKG